MSDKPTQNTPTNSVPDGQTDPERAEAKCVQPRESWWQNKRFFTIVLLLLLVLIILTGLLIFYGTAYHCCKKKISNATVDDDLDFLDIVDADSGRVGPAKNVRLPFDILPRFYRIRLQVYLRDGETFPFNGSVEIDVYCSVSTDSIYVHAYHSLNVSLDKVKVQTFTVQRQPDKELGIKKITYDKDLQWFVITMATRLEAGKYYRVTFGEFHSVLQTDLKGWYLSSYVENKEEKRLATSQFQPTDARRVFPCWDEPVFKAQFQVTVIRRKDYHSLSNMGLQETIPLGQGWYADVFYPTVNTSTYVLAFVVSQFSSLSGRDSKQRNFTVWARPEVIHTAQYSLDVGRKIIQFFEEYFEVPYQLEKTDMIAVPDFAAGAMENWGLMIYREPTMLWDETTNTAYNRQKVAAVISHEIAHQWFGNLVTLTWWDDLWLNEGFASFCEVLGVDHVHPDWEMEEFNLLDNMPKAMANDAGAYSRPIVQKVNYPGEINAIFDLIVYNKGAAMVRMIEGFLGRETFRQGIKKYLSNYKFQNTVEDDLWNSLSEAARERGQSLNIKPIMDTWLRQMNFPLVTVEQIAPGLFRFTQSRYLDVTNTTRVRNESPYNFTWHIPITYASPTSLTWEEPEVIWLTAKTMTTRLKVEPNDWYVINIRQTGFYRVNYVDTNWERLTKQLMKNHTVFPTTQRIQIIEDMFNLANQGTLSFETLLDMTKYMEHEDSYAPLEAASRTFGYLLRMLAVDPTYGHLRAYVRRLFDRQLRHVDWETMIENTDHLKHMKRMTVTQIACHAGHRICVNKAKQMFADWMAKNETNRIPPALRQAVYCTAIKHGGQVEWTFLHSQLSGSPRMEEVANIRFALPCSKDAWLLKRYLNELVSMTTMDASDVTEAIQPFANNPLAQILLWENIREAWQQVVSGIVKDAKDSQNNSTVLMLLRIFAKRASSMQGVPLPKDIVAIGKTTTNENTRAIFKRYFREIYKRAEHNANWVQKHRVTISKWLERNVPDSTILL